jgi:hypothetical protein
MRGTNRNNPHPSILVRGNPQGKKARSYFRYTAPVFHFLQEFGGIILCGEDPEVQLGWICRILRGRIQDHLTGGGAMEPWSPCCLLGILAGDRVDIGILEYCPSNPNI